MLNSIPFVFSIHPLIFPSIQKPIHHLSIHPPTTNPSRYVFNHPLKSAIHLSLTFLSLFIHLINLSSIHFLSIFSFIHFIFVFSIDFHLVFQPFFHQSIFFHSSIQFLPFSSIYPATKQYIHVSSLRTRHSTSHYLSLFILLVISIIIIIFYYSCTFTIIFQYLFYFYDYIILIMSFTISFLFSLLISFVLFFISS